MKAKSDILLPFRQIHLDFHTSGEIPRVGVKFNKKKFQEALLLGHVDSITLFSKCHHGWSYHPTRIGKTHPTLRRNLLAEQVEACREIGVRCPLYLSAGLDQLVADQRPDWLVKSKEGVNYPPLKKRCFQALRWNTPYLDYLCAQIEEVNSLWPDNDGIFLDIVGPRMDYSQDSLMAIAARGLDAKKDSDVLAYAMEVLNAYFKKTTATALKGNPRRPIFHNSGNIPVGAREFLAWNSHLELESLPTGGWGWDHFPLTARYAQTTGYDFLGMTGKFHTTWGEFGGYKRPASLRYECDGMLAMGAKCSVGDQLHPSGEMNRETYRIVGEAYSRVATKEPWCKKVRPIALIGLVSAVHDQKSVRFFGENNAADEGASRMLLELKLPFLVLDSRAEWDGFELVILPDEVLMDEFTLEKAQKFLANGGKILASGSSLLNPERTDFALKLPLDFKGRSRNEVDYLVPGNDLEEIPVRAPLVIHGGAWDVIPEKRVQILARRADPYFNRDHLHFFGHQHAPDKGYSRYPGIVRHAGVVWFAHSIFTRYRVYGQPLYRDYVLNVLRLLLPEGLPVETNLPSGGRTALFDQPSEKRFVFHALFAMPSLRGGNPLDHIDHLGKPQLEIIEELIPLHDVQCVLRLPQKAVRVRLVPEMKDLEFTWEAGKVSFVIPLLEGHQMVEISYR